MSDDLPNRIQAPTHPHLVGVVAFARETFRNDGAEGETVHQLCDAAERLQRAFDNINGAYTMTMHTLANVAQVCRASPGENAPAMRYTNNPHRPVEDAVMALRAERDELQARHDEQKVQRIMVTAERDKACRERDASNALLDVSQTMRKEMVGRPEHAQRERDEALAELVRVDDGVAVESDVASALNRWPTIAPFVVEMAAMLDANAHKGGWQGLYPEDLALRVREEAHELFTATKDYMVAADRTPELRQRIIDEAADAANMAMMVADVVRDGPIAEFVDGYEPKCHGEWSGGSGGHRRHSGACDATATSFDDPYWYCEDHSPLVRKIKQAMLEQREADISLLSARVAQLARELNQTRPQLRNVTGMLSTLTESIASHLDEPELELLRGTVEDANTMLNMKEKGNT